MIELRGPAAVLQTLLDRHLRPGAAGQPGRVSHGVWRDPAGAAVDDLLAVRTAGDRLELHLHGGRGVVAAMVGALQAAGAALDAAPATPLADAIAHAVTPRLAKVLLAQRTVVPDWKAGLQAAMHANDETALRHALQLAADGAALARHVLDPPPGVVLAGRPNAGKSTLFNALVGASRVLVSEQAGTTRDAVDARIALGGIPVRLIDTAGFDPDAARLADSRLERRGQIAAIRALRRADLVLHLIDATRTGGAGIGHPPDALDRRFWPAHGAVLTVYTQIDRLAPTEPRPEGLAVSATTGENLDELRRDVAIALRLPHPANRIPPVPLGIGVAHDALRQRLRTALPASASVPDLRSLAASLLADAPPDFWPVPDEVR